MVALSILFNSLNCFHKDDKEDSAFINLSWSSFWSFFILAISDLMSEIPLPIFSNLTITVVNSVVFSLLFLLRNVYVASNNDKKDII